MSITAVNWALSQRVGSGYLKGTLVAIACLTDGGPVQKSAIAREAGLTSVTIGKHLTRLKVLGFITMASRSVSLNMVRK